MPTKTQRAHPSRAGGRRLFLPVLLACGLVPAWTALGDSGPLYRWTDEAGVTVYSRRPPAGTGATRLTLEPGPSAEESQRAEERIRSLVEQDTDRRKEAELQEGESRDQSEQQTARRTRCKGARENLANLENPRVAQVRTPEGETLALTDEVRARYQEEARRVIQESCD